MALRPDARLWKSITALVVVVVAAVVAVANAPAESFGFSSQPSAPSLQARGTLSVPTPLAPGTSTASTLEVRNLGGTGRVVFALDASGSTPLRDHLQVRIERAGTTVYAGPIPQSREFQLGRLAGGERLELRIHLSFPQTGDNSLQGTRLTLAARWLASSSS